jgi:hypothetical protein
VDEKQAFVQRLDAEYELARRLLTYVVSADPSKKGTRPTYATYFLRDFLHKCCQYL